MRFKKYRSNYFYDKFSSYRRLAKTTIQFYKLNWPKVIDNNLKRSPVHFWKYVFFRGPGSSVGIATDYGLDGSGIESRWGRDFFARPDRSWGSPSFLYSGYRVFSGGKLRPGAWRWPLTPFKRRGLERVELYLYPPLGHNRACNGVTLLLLATWELTKMDSTMLVTCDKCRM